MDLKVELERFGAANDAVHQDSSRRMFNITHDTGEFLTILVLAMSARSVLEIGTSNGYSTLWLAEGVRATGGKVTTVDISDYKVGLASQNFARAGLESFITLLHADAGEVLRGLPEAVHDIVFLDSDRSTYRSWWPHVRRALRPGGLLVVDNAVSHSVEMQPFMALVKADPDFTASVVPVGNGEFLAVKLPSRQAFT